MKPLLVTMGDAAGIGPEIIVRAFERGELADAVVIGDVGVLRRAGAPMTAVVDAPADLAAVPPGCLPVLPPPGLPAGLAALPWGRVDARCGAAAARCIEHAVALVRAGNAAALVTAPIHKEALAAAGVPFPGHTEMLQALATAPGAAPPPVRMMLANDELRVVLVTIHQSLRRAIDAVTQDAVLQTLRIAHRAAAAWDLPRPRIGVAGLNPHAGEGGLFGDEELRIIGPAVQAAVAEGIDARRPVRTRHRLHARPPRARPPGRVRPRGGDDARPWPDPGQVPRRRAGRQRHARPALRAHQPRPRHGVRHRRPRHGRPGEPDRRAGDGAPAGTRS